MSFWDSSAVIPLLVREETSADLRALLRAERRMTVWWTVLPECHSALRRLERAGVANSRQVDDAAAALEALSAEWAEVLPSARVRARCLRLLAQHPLRAADALHLAAALDWADEAPEGKPFVCLDQRLREAAHREGFRVLPA